MFYVNALDPYDVIKKSSKATHPQQLYITLIQSLYKTEQQKADLKQKSGLLFCVDSESVQGVLEQAQSTLHSRIRMDIKRSCRF